MHEAFMQRALQIAATSHSESGCLPFAAVVVRDGEIVGEGLNRATQKHDPTAHGEVEALRDACARLGTTQLEGCVVYTTCEPCAMCVASMCLSGIERVFYAASGEDSAAMFERLAARDPAWGRRLSVEQLREEVGLPLASGRLRGSRLLAEAGREVLSAFAAARLGD
ncbi:MAG: nucleoside deaminase [Gammaproteobacteria bacterium]|nr:nucleoside deaminase [Gammaproteobacteria bacterium]